MLNGPTWVGQALACRLLRAQGGWNHEAFFDYVDRWVAEAADGTVDRKTFRPTGYDPFSGSGEFVKAMCGKCIARARPLVAPSAGYREVSARNTSKEWSFMTLSAHMEWAG
jgi:hypothetical protein